MLSKFIIRLWEIMMMMKTLIGAKLRGRCMDYSDADICYSFFILFLLFLNPELILIVYNIWGKHMNFYVMVVCTFNLNFINMHYYLNKCLKFLHERTFKTCYELLRTLTIVLMLTDGVCRNFCLI